MQIRSCRAALAAAVVLACTGLAGAMTLEEVLARHYEARGGLEKLRAVESARMTGRMIMPGGMEAPFVWEWKKPGKVRIEFTVQGMTGIMAADGEKGWRVMPFMGKTEPEAMTPEEARQLEPQANFSGMLVDYADKGYELEYAGEVEVEGTPAHKIKVTDKDTGDVTWVYLDAEHFVEIRHEAKRMVNGQPIEAEVTIGDYKEVDGLMLAHSIASKVKGAPAGQTIVIDKVELDVEIPDERFEMPEKPAAAGAGKD